MPLCTHRSHSGLRFPIMYCYSPFGKPVPSRFGGEQIIFLEGSLGIRWNLICSGGDLEILLCVIKDFSMNTLGISVL